MSLGEQCVCVAFNQDDRPLKCSQVSWVKAIPRGKEEGSAERPRKGKRAEASFCSAEMKVELGNEHVGLEEVNGPEG